MTDATDVILDINGYFVPASNASAQAFYPVTPCRVATIGGLDNMTSSSSRSQSNVTLQFTLDRNIDAAAQDVQNAISAVVRKLPSNMPAPPNIRKVNPTDQPIIQFSMNSVSFPATVVDE